MAVVLVVFVSLGFFFMIGLFFVASFFIIKMRKKKSSDEKDDDVIIRADEHLKVKEDIVKGPFGPQVVLSMEKDKRFEEEIVKKENKMKSSEFMQGQNREFSTGDLESGESSSKYKN
ncbi:tracheary element differentiation-related 6 [Striga hermonthica]|uniref:Tracheary element differentiation-related 6 n=1 Tax=Striga hermonthica TaxID=68872 RepID=A0A9N7MRW9_STRHE|nr:tracheary element differentiation-related 6 [Striga hermonthica]